MPHPAAGQTPPPIDLGLAYRILKENAAHAPEPLIGLAARILANPLSSSDVLLIVADAVTQSAEEIGVSAESGLCLAEIKAMHKLADTLRSHAPERAGVAL
jgi:hypothetical protein